MPRSLQKAAKPGCHTTAPVLGSWEITSGEALSQRICSGNPPKWRHAASMPSSQSSCRSARKARQKSRRE